MNVYDESLRLIFLHYFLSKLLAIGNSILLTLFQTYRLPSIYIQVEGFNKYKSQKVISKKWTF